MDGGDVVLHFQHVPLDVPCEGTEHRYRAVADGSALEEVDVPQCGFGAWTASGT
jgi:hypothetical protein